MNRIKTAPTYEDKWLEVERPQPLSDLTIESTIQGILDGRIDQDISDQVYTNLKKEMSAWLFASKLNTITGFDSFNRLDICLGCTQFIDTIYMQDKPQVLAGDYRYHERLGNHYSYPGQLKEGVPLIVALPFPSTGAVHTQMREILNEAQDKGISVHVDGAWLTCSRGIIFDLSHPSIKSISISLSKGLGLGWNRVGLRWTKDTQADAITIMNDFNMNCRAVAKIGLHFIRNFPTDYLWNKYGEVYYKVCKDFNLTPTNSIYLALKDNQPVGLSPLIRHVAKQ